MANKTVTVTSASVVTGDTLASYNVYTDKPSVKTLVGTMTPAEGLAGKVFNFTDNLNHNVTVYPVGTTNGELNSPSNVVVVDLSGSGFTNPETQTYIDRLTTLSRALPSSGQQTKIDTFIGSLKSAGVWTKADVISLPAIDAGAASSKVMLLPPANFEMTEVSTPVFEVDKGWRSDGVDGYNQIPFNMLTDGTNFTLNNNCILTYNPFADYVVGNVIWGCYNTTDTDGYHINTTAARAATQSQVNIIPAINVASKLIAIRRSASANFDVVSYNSANDTLIETNIVEASVALPNEVLGLNSRAGSPGTKNVSSGVGFIFIGSSLTNTEIESIKTAIETYLL